MRIWPGIPIPPQSLHFQLHLLFGSVMINLQSNPKAGLSPLLPTDGKPGAQSQIETVEEFALRYFNTVQEATEIVGLIRDNPAVGSPNGRGIPLPTAQQILSTRASLTDQQFPSLQAVYNVAGIGTDTEADIIYSFQILLAGLEPPILRKGDILTGVWINEEAGIMLDIHPMQDTDAILISTIETPLITEYVETVYVEEADAFVLESFPEGFAAFLDVELSFDSLIRVEGVEGWQIGLSGEQVLELSFGGQAWVFVADEVGPKVTAPVVEDAFAFSQCQICIEEAALLNDNPLDDPDDYDTLPPDIWKDGDTEEFLRRLAARVKEELEKKFDLDEVAKELALQRAIEQEASKIVSKFLADREGKRLRNRLLKEGYSQARIDAILKRLLPKLEKEYLYKRPGIIKRFLPITKYKNLLKLLKNPKTWLRGRVAKFLIKGLGKRVLAIPGLIDDLLTIGEALYRLYQAQQAREGAREAHRQADELQKELERFRRQLTPEQRARLEELYRREREFFEEQRRLHRKRLQAPRPGPFVEG